MFLQLKLSDFIHVEHNYPFKIGAIRTLTLKLKWRRTHKNIIYRLCSDKKRRRLSKKKEEEICENVQFNTEKYSTTVDFPWRQCDSRASMATTTSGLRPSQPQLPV